MADTTTAHSEVATKVDFSGIRYSQAWEDPRCLAEALPIGPDDIVLSIAAAGDNSIALLLEDPARVIAVDLSPAQVALAHLKVAGIAGMDAEELHELLGVRPSSRRVELYRRIRSLLPAEARGWWDTQEDLIAAGVIHAGRLERYFAMFRRYVLPVTHGRRVVEGLFAPRDADGRARYWNERFDTRRWRVAQRLFFSKTVLGRFGRDPEFFEDVEIGDVGAWYGERARHAICDLPTEDNWFLEYMLLGRYRNLEQAHPYLRPSNLETLRDRLDRLELRCTEIERVCDELAPSAVDHFNLSNIFEWMSADAAESLLRRLVDVSRVGGRLAYWNNLVERQRPDSLAGVLRPLDELATGIHERDRAFLYRAFRVEEVVAHPRPGGTV